MHVAGVICAGDIYAVGSSADSSVVVSVVEPRSNRIRCAWQIHNVTVTTLTFLWTHLSVFASA